jgi:nickel/cobalt exporter
VRPGRRVLAALGLTAVLTGVGGLAGAPAALAHPLGNFTVNHYSGLDLTPGEVRVRYVLDMAEIPTFQERPAMDTDGDGHIRAAERQAWATGKAADLLAGVSLSAGGSSVPLATACAAGVFRQGQGGLPILRLVATFIGSLPPSGTLAYLDSNDPDHIGWREITARAEPGVSLVRSSVPARSVSNELLVYPNSLLASPLHVQAASVAFAASAGGEAMPAPSCSSATTSAPQNGFASLVTRRLSPVVLILALGLAIGFGAAHALLPGHGKTITAAYLVSSGSRARTAVLAGAAVALMHMLSVLALGLTAAVLLRSLPTERVYPWLGLLTGLVALGLGGALLVLRVRARRRGENPWEVHGHGHDQGRRHGGDHVHEGDHVHKHVPATERELALVGAAAPSQGSGHPRPHSHPAGPGHSHDDDHGHARHEEEPPARVGIASRKGLAALAVAGGILPSPTAIVVLTGAISYHRLGYGLALIAAFSFGLAAALILVGVLALRARQMVSRRLKGRWSSVLPLASAAVIMGFGVFFVLRGIGQIA